MHPRYDPSRMHRQVQYIAEDGTIFSSPEGCAEYERHSKFMNALAGYIQNKFPDITEEALLCLEPLWIEIFNDPKSFHSVVTAALPAVKKGRPKSIEEPKILKKFEAPAVVENTPLELSQNTTQPITVRK